MFFVLFPHIWLRRQSSAVSPGGSIFMYMGVSMSKETSQVQSPSGRKEREVEGACCTRARRHSVWRTRTSREVFNREQFPRVHRCQKTMFHYVQSRPPRHLPSVSLPPFLPSSRSLQVWTLSRGVGKHACPTCVRDCCVVGYFIIIIIFIFVLL